MPRGSVAQLVERTTENREVTGSTPVGATETLVWLLHTGVSSCVAECGPIRYSPEVLSEHRFERRQVSLDHVANGVDVDAEVLVNEDVPKPSNLRPRDLGMSVGDLPLETGHGFSALRVTRQSHPKEPTVRPAA